MSDAHGSMSVFVLDGSLGRAEFTNYLQSLDANIAMGRPFVMIVDGTAPDLCLIEAPDRRWQLSRAGAIGQLHRGIAFVTGTMTRERVRALYALQPPGVRYAFFSEMDEAIAWSKSALDGERRQAVGSRKTQPLMRAVTP